MATPAAIGGCSIKTHLSRLVEAITALQGPERTSRLGVARGQFTVPDSIDAANPLIAELFELP
jgi:hypothetical protein